MAPRAAGSGRASRRRRSSSRGTSRAQAGLRTSAPCSETSSFSRASCARRGAALPQPPVPLPLPCPLKPPPAVASRFMRGRPDALCAALDAARAACVAAGAADGADEAARDAARAVAESREFAHVSRARLRGTPLAVLAEAAELPAAEALPARVLGPAGVVDRMQHAVRGGASALTPQDVLVLVWTRRVLSDLCSLAFLRERRAAIDEALAFAARMLRETALDAATERDVWTDAGETARGLWAASDGAAAQAAARLSLWLEAARPESNPQPEAAAAGRGVVCLRLTLAVAWDPLGADHLRSQLLAFLGAQPEMQGKRLRAVRCGPAFGADGAPDATHTWVQVRSLSLNHFTLPVSLFLSLSLCLSLSLSLSLSLYDFTPLCLRYRPACPSSRGARRSQWARAAGTRGRRGSAASRCSSPTGTGRGPSLASPARATWSLPPRLNPERRACCFETHLSLHPPQRPVCP
jgi:hypothetical protein